MPWRANLVPASFRGVGFQVDETESPIAGRRVAVHEYPGRDEPFVEDMGRRTKRWEIEAFVVGDDYADVRNRLVDACDQPGPGELVHPYLGSLQVACTACRLTERTREGRMARFSLSFTEAGENRYPASLVNTGDAVIRSALPGVDSSIEQLLGEFSVDEITPAIIEDRVREFRGRVRGITDRAEDFAETVQNVEGRVRRVRDTVSDVADFFGFF